METCTSDLADGDQVFHISFTCYGCFYASTTVMGRGDHRNRLLGNVDPKGQTLFVDLRKTGSHKLRVLRGDVEEDVVLTALLQFIIYSSGYDISRSELHYGMIVAHETSSLLVRKDCTLTPKGL